MELTQKTHDHCKVPGCWAPGTHQMHENAPNCRFCDRHFKQVLLRTVRSILADDDDED